jgi:hypothetical protein
MSSQIIIQRFRKLFTEKSPYMGKLEGATVCADAMACRGSKDHLFLYARIEKDRIAEIKYECAMCDPEMLVTGEILCRLAHGRALLDLGFVDRAAFSADLGFEADDMLTHFDGARLVLDQVLENHRQGKPCEM